MAKVKFISFEEQVYLTLLYDGLKSGEIETHTYQMQIIAEEYKQAFGNWNQFKNYLTTIDTRVRAMFDKLKKDGKIIAVGKTGNRTNYKIAVTDEAQRESEMIEQFNHYVGYLQDEIAENAYENLILTEKFVHELLLFHEEEPYYEEELIAWV